MCKVSKTDRARRRWQSLGPFTTMFFTASCDWRHEHEYVVPIVYSLFYKWIIILNFMLNYYGCQSMWISRCVNCTRLIGQVAAERICVLLQRCFLLSTVIEDMSTSKWCQMYTHYLDYYTEFYVQLLWMSINVDVRMCKLYKTDQARIEDIGMGMWCQMRILLFIMDYILN